MTKSLPKLIRDFWRGATRFVDENPLDPLPIRKGFRGYTGAGLRRDCRAGLNVALIAFPQGLAYAVVAGLPIAFGVTCSIAAAIVAPLFSGSRHTVLGPTNATAFMIFSYFAAYPGLAAHKVALMPLVVLLVGLLLCVGAYLRIADLLQYISRTVVIGYITGAALLIIANQTSHLLGVTVENSGVARSFFSIIAGVLAEIPNAAWYPLAIGIGTGVIYLALSRRFPKLPAFAITLALSTAVAEILRRLFHLEAATLPAVRPGNALPDLSVFTAPGIFDRVAQMSGLALAVAFLAGLENSVMAKTLASRSGDRPDINQDMLGAGAANVACAFLSGMPASGSMIRSSLNFSSGAKGRLSSIISGLLCLLGLVTLGPLVAHVPESCLAALVICVALSLINRRHIRIAFAATRSDAVTLVVTFLATLLVPLHVAVFVGVGTSIILYLRKASRPQLVEYEFNEHGDLTEMEVARRKIPSISIVHVEGELFFGAAELFRTQIQRTCVDPNLRIIILRLKNARHLDATSVMALEELILFLRANGRDLIISGAMKEVYRVLRNSGLIEVLGKENLFLGSPMNPNLSTRNALRRAQEILGTDKADVRIYYDPNRPREG